MQTDKIAFTPGEPAGIGLDLIILNAQQVISEQLLTFTDPDLLLERARLLNLTISLRENTPCEKLGDIAIYPITCPKPVQVGVLNADNAGFVLKTLDSAIIHTQNNKTKAMLTGPVHKGIMNQAGFNFSGHTEYLSHKAQAKTVMMLANDVLKVALVTTHLPLSKVCQHLTQGLLKQTITILHDSLMKQFGINRPKIAICGLNPHAGEQGYLGKEEIDIINPVIKKLRQTGFDLSDALPADTLFTPDKLAKYDCVLSMYHDQGLPVLKALGFEHSVNITLGLPFIRVSVDHGTALDLAGTGNISLGSFNTALTYAKALINQTK